MAESGKTAEFFFFAFFNPRWPDGGEFSEGFFVPEMPLFGIIFCLPVFMEKMIWVILDFKIQQLRQLLVFNKGAVTS